MPGISSMTVPSLVRVRLRAPPGGGEKCRCFVCCAFERQTLCWRLRYDFVLVCIHEILPYSYLKSIASEVLVLCNVSFNSGLNFFLGFV